MHTEYMSEYTKAELGRIQDKIRKCNEAAEKLDGLDPKTRETVLYALGETIRVLENNRQMVENYSRMGQDIINPPSQK